MRGDNTLVYFFTMDEVNDLFVDAGMDKVELLTDQRLLVNRKTKQTMYRVWMQGRFRKPGNESIISFRGASAAADESVSAVGTKVGSN